MLHMILFDSYILRKYEEWGRKLYEFETQTDRGEVKGGPYLKRKFYKWKRLLKQSGQEVMPLENLSED